MDFKDRIRDCELRDWRDKDKRDPRIVELIVLHRIENSENILDLAKLFSDPAIGTGGRFPYHFIIDSRGVVHQCVPLGIASPGAGTANRAGIQVALYGDFRKRPPTPAQLAACVELCAAFVQWKPSLKIEGHTDKAGRSSDPKKVCPGKYLEPASVKLSVADRVERLAKLGLTEKGLRF
jgi:hypothetical protein